MTFAIDSTAASAAAATTKTTPSRETKQVMDGDAYMKLFLTTMQNQDPTSPMSSAEMMQSTATLSQMQMLDGLGSIMQSLVLSQNQSTATDMIGREITYIDSTTGKNVTGLVEGVSMSEASPVLLIGEIRVPLGNVSIVNK